MQGSFVFLNILLATFIDSLMGLVGIFSFLFRIKNIQKFVKHLVAFAAGTMLGGAFIHLLPEAAELSNIYGELIIIGFLIFFFFERVLKWKHCHDVDCEKHSVSWLIIIGDGMHNFIDGIVIASAFLVNTYLGWVTTLVIIAHEVPQEIGNFAVLLHNGFSRIKATTWTFISQATCIIGGLMGFFIGSSYKSILIPLAAGGFIYIAAVDLIPELHLEKNLKGSVGNFLFFLFGILVMEALKLAFKT